MSATIINLILLLLALMGPSSDQGPPSSERVGSVLIWL